MDCFLFVFVSTLQENIKPRSDGKGDGEDVVARRGKSQNSQCKKEEVQTDQRRTSTVIANSPNPSR